MPTLLVVEDDDILRRMIQRSFARQDFLVLAAKDALEAVQRAASTDGAIDLILVDLSLPGMCGTNVAHMLQHMRPEAHLAFMMGSTCTEAEIRKAKSLNGRLIRKPFPLEGLITELRQMLHPWATSLADKEPRGLAQKACAT